MNPLNLFKFLKKEKGKQPPLRIKIILGLPLKPEELVMDRIFLRNKKLTKLPDGLKVKEWVDLVDSTIESLPKGLEVGGNLVVNGTKISSLPPDLQVGGNLYILNTPLAEKSYKEIRAILKTGYIKGKIIR